MWWAFRRIDLADPQFGGCSKKKIWLICKKTIRSGGRVWAYPRKRRPGRSLRLRGWGSGNPLYNCFLCEFSFRKSLWLGGSLQPNPPSEEIWQINFLGGLAPTQPPQQRVFPNLLTFLPGAKCPPSRQLRTQRETVTYTHAAV